VQIIENRKDIFGSNITTGGRLAFASVRERAMCEKCDEIEETIQRYRWIEPTIMDQVTVGRTKELVADSLPQKDALHPK
jgi:hypothetical protein